MSRDPLSWGSESLYDQAYDDAVGPPMPVTARIASDVRLILPEPPEWMEEAACRGMDTNVFYPADGGTAAAAYAKAICYRCPVRNECRDYSMKHHEKHGVWGGCTERDRKRLRVERRIA